MEEPPQEARHAEVCELDPLVRKLRRVDREVAEEEGGDYDRGEEADIEGVDRVMNVGSVLLEKAVGAAPADDAQDAVNVGAQVVEGEVGTIDVGALVHEQGVVVEQEDQPEDGGSNHE